MTVKENLRRAIDQDTDLGIPGFIAQTCQAALVEIERLERELAEVESRRDLAIANYVRTLAERDALTDRLIRAGLKS